MLKRHEPSSHEKTKKKYKYILLSQRSQSEKTMYCMIPTLSCCESQNYRDSKKTLVARDDGEGGRNRQSTEHTGSDYSVGPCNDGYRS